ncbi:hypothetical protein DY000_02002976 [Brassica cretica]|uniref:Uncharacterized protein n=1 Tax=Brassica cretica TaxID=69181 RepID=A0ABQ7C3S7_BRACR|nr:hypothetical protein DY000_02002976 [Brassica cretica]
MGLIKNTVHYCCVSRDNQILYAYNGGDQSNESLAGLCLEKTPPFHAWYFESIGRSSKQEKKRGKDHVVSVRGAELDEHRNSNDRADRCEASSAAETSSQKECVPRRGRSGSHSFEWKWRRLVQIVLAIDAAICLTLFCVWLAICEGIKCTRS